MPPCSSSPRLSLAPSRLHGNCRARATVQTQHRLDPDGDLEQKLAVDCIADELSSPMPLLPALLGEEGGSQLPGEATAFVPKHRTDWIPKPAFVSRLFGGHGPTNHYAAMPSFQLEKELNLACRKLEQAALEQTKLEEQQDAMEAALNHCDRATITAFRAVERRAGIEAALKDFARPEALARAEAAGRDVSDIHWLYLTRLLQDTCESVQRLTETVSAINAELRRKNQDQVAEVIWSYDESEKR